MAHGLTECLGKDEVMSCAFDLEMKPRIRRGSYDYICTCLALSCDTFTLFCSSFLRINRHWKQTPGRSLPWLGCINNELEV